MFVVKVYCKIDLTVNFHTNILSTRLTAPGSLRMCAEGTVTVFPASQDLFENHRLERDTIVVFENEGCR